MSEKPTLEDLRTHIMDHYQDLQQLQFRLLGTMRQVMTSYHALDEIMAEAVNSSKPKRLHVSGESLREMIIAEEDLAVEVGTPYTLGERIEGTATYENGEWRFEPGGIVGDPKAILMIPRGDQS